ncbi:hypothetical protein A3C18_01295 [Candidatus Kaiserbacteria bacterium RIFCSPHIGHO2_02_FULL_54_11b]|uniref:Blue (type 1) copper domain-containing protein n=2 Tax=Candidatus Kaiseribacteriota TaxID=1752734 RepID=A0A1F6CR79_9BACT|nr:MAG: hypothetical protein A2704_06720 [Candidatus Kaiserbacteria bacterium RIFCSPHIGHO2_01_FULL_54_36b]OGG64595.1 MAG: hypothetical protein A3C18_01295 [Candidatus Kaiserbacteria bacterium RIFCSPHIGHO2_02_FULL_54_11b]
MQNTWIWIVIAVIVVGGGFWWWQSSQVPMADTGTPVGTIDDGTTPPPPPSVPSFATVTYGATGFSPSAVTIKKGGTVTWNNERTTEMWVATAQHPNHTVYSGTSRTAHCPDTSGAAFDQCAGGNNYTFKFEKVGTWNYHDHLNPAAFGSVTVVE